MPKLIAPSLFPLTSTTSPLQTSPVPPQLWPIVEPSTSPQQVLSLEPPPPSHSIQHEKNSVHGYSGNTLNKRRRTGDDLFDAFMEISDIMTYNQMQPIKHVYIQNSPYEASTNNSLVLPHQQHIDNSDEIDNVDNVHDAYNGDNSDTDIGDKEEKKKTSYTTNNFHILCLRMILSTTSVSAKLLPSQK